VNAIAVHPDSPDILFVGTDIGVFATFDAGSSWIPFSKGLARSPVTDLEFHTNRIIQPDLTLRAATHGRSMWEAIIPADVAPAPAVLSPAGGEVVYSGIKQKISWTGIAPPVDIRLQVGFTENLIIIAENVEGSSYTWIPQDIETDQASVVVTSRNAQQSAASADFAIRPAEPGTVLAARGVDFRPYGMHYFDGRLLVADYDASRLYTLDPEDMSFAGNYYEATGYLTDADREDETGDIYIMSMNNETGSGGRILRFSADGQMIGSFTSPLTEYPAALEFVDGGMLIAERDGQQRMALIDPESGSVQKYYSSPAPVPYGPRCIASDDSGNVYQVITAFPNITLTYSELLKMNASGPDVVLDRFRLEDPDGVINARGVAYDPDDGSFWISDFGGVIFKVAGFDSGGTPVAELSDFSKNIKVWPNPASDRISIEPPPGTMPGWYDISISDAMGREVSHRMKTEYRGSPIELQLPDIAPGVYRISFGNGASLYYSCNLVVMN
ncbi:MAG: hypothetical protein ACLFQX_13575, partial [Candidatus Kapaibacterium sp.]